jgi:hypothetical protein
MKFSTREKLGGLMVLLVVSMTWSTMAITAGASGTRASSHRYSQVVLDARSVAGAAAQQTSYEDNLLSSQFDSGSGTPLPGVDSAFVTQFAALSTAVSGGSHGSVALLTLQVAHIRTNWVYYEVDLSQYSGGDSFACAKVSKYSLAWRVTSGKC